MLMINMINKENVGEHIESSAYADKHWMAPSTFVTLWQTSADIDEFIQRCTQMNKLLLERFGVYDLGHGLEVPNVKIPAEHSENTYRARASRYRKKGVNLKKLQRRVLKGECEWDNLAKLAEQLA